MDFKNSTLVATIRIIAGLVFVVFGLNGFLNFMPGLAVEGQAAVLMGALFGTPYMLVLIKGLEIVVGLLLLFGKYVPLATILMAPLTVNYMAFHLAYDLANIAPALFLFLVNVYLVCVHWKTFKPLVAS